MTIWMTIVPQIEIKLLADLNDYKYSYTYTQSDRLLRINNIKIFRSDENVYQIVAENSPQRIQIQKDNVKRLSVESV